MHTYIYMHAYIYKYIYIYIYIYILVSPFPPVPYYIVGYITNKKIGQQKCQNNIAQTNIHKKFPKFSTITWSLHKVFCPLRVLVA